VLIGDSPAPHRHLVAATLFDSRHLSNECGVVDRRAGELNPSAVGSVVDHNEVPTGPRLGLDRAKLDLRGGHVDQRTNHAVDLDRHLRRLFQIGVDRQDGVDRPYRGLVRERDGDLVVSEMVTSYWDLDLPLMSSPSSSGRTEVAMKGTLL